MLSTVVFFYLLNAKQDLINIKNVFVATTMHQSTHSSNAKQHIFLRKDPIQLPVSILKVNVSLFNVGSSVSS